MKIAILILSLLLPALGLGQTYSIDWYKISGGGGTSTGGVFTVNGTIGQHDSGQVFAGGNFSITGGFWSIIAAVQTPGAPTLYVGNSGNAVTVFWNTVPGWNLQQNSNLGNASGWSTSTGLTSSNGTNYLNIISPAANLFFRVVHP
jgi:hypothetical protein